MKSYLKNITDLERHNKIMEQKLNNNPFKHSNNKPLEYPCVIISFITNNQSGFQINHEFVYKKDF